MAKLKLTPTASGTMPTQALVDAVNECEVCEGSGKVQIFGRAYTPCHHCTVLRNALKPLTEEVDDNA